MLFAAIVLPHFCLQSVLRFREDLRTQATAIVDEASAKGRILDMTTAAEVSGVFAGMPSTQALARCPGLILLPRVTAQEKIATQILLEIAASLSPGIEETGEGICTVDLRGAKISDPESWGREIAQRFAALHLEACIGIAATADLALFAAHAGSAQIDQTDSYHQESNLSSAEDTFDALLLDDASAQVRVIRDSTAFLSARALEELSPSPELLRILHDWGIRDLGGLLQLPKEEIATRLGPEAAQLWERATGRSQRLLRYVRTPEIFEEFFEFEHEVETVEPLLFLLRRFLEQLTLRLQAVYRVAASMRLVLPLENDREHARDFTIPAPTTDVETLFRILHTHLDGLRLDHRPVALRLTVQAAISKKQQLRIFENPLRDPNRFGETLGRLAALVGNENIGIPEAGATHRPGKFRLLPSLIAEEPPDLSIGLPLRRYRPPHPAQVETNHGHPVTVNSPALRGFITSALGPYRISGEWWDAEAWELEEWDVELDGEGVGIYRLSRKGAAWFVEGCYSEGGVG
jgi:protein ImuB